MDDVKKYRNAVLCGKIYHYHKGNWKKINIKLNKTKKIRI